MKLAEALLLRAEYREKLGNLQNRILANLKVQENEAPHEDPQELLSQAAELDQKLCTLVQQINRTNAAVHLPDSTKTIADALAERDCLRTQQARLAAVATKAIEQNYRLTHTEVRMVVTVNVKEIQKQTDHLAHAYRELDTTLQGLNWTTELLD